MDQKTKFIIIGLSGVAVILFIFLFSTYSAKQKITQERDVLKEENTQLGTKIERLSASLRENENRLSALNKELDRVSREKIEIERKFDLANKEKEALVAKLKSQAAQPQAAAAQAASPSTDAYLAGMLKAKAELELQLAGARNELKATQINNDQLAREKNTLELELNNLKREKDELKRQFEYNKKLADALSQELAGERTDRLQIQDAFKSVKNENGILLRQLKSLNNRKSTLEKKLFEVQQQKNELERQFSEMEVMLTDKLAQINSFKEQMQSLRQGVVQEELKKESVELPAIVVRPQAEAPAMAAYGEITAATKGRVLAVNRENNFVVIDLGENSGIKAGEAFQVYRDQKPIATIEVIQVRKDISACDIKREASPVKVGDTIK